MDDVEVNKGWNVDDALRDLDTAKSVLGREDEVGLALELFKTNLPLAVMSLVQIAQHSPDERNRIKASTYIVERVLGGVGAVVPPSAANDPLTNLLGDIVVHVSEEEAIARARSKFQDPVDDGAEALRQAARDGGAQAGAAGNEGDEDR